MTTPSRGSGANTARRVPRTRSARPSCAASQLRSRCAGVSPLCRATMRRPAKRRVKRSISCGVRLISGTSTSAWRPARERQAGGAQVDLGLAAAGDAVQEGRSGRFARHRRGDRAGRLALVGGQRRRRVGRRSGRPRPTCRRPRCRRRMRSATRIAAEPAQLGRQHRQGDLADAALVVARREFDQRAPVGAERRQGVADLGDLAQLVGRIVCGARRPGQPGDLAPPERDPHQHSGVERALTSVAERRGQAGVARRIDQHPDDRFSVAHAHRLVRSERSSGAVHVQARKSMIWRAFCNSPPRLWKTLWVTSPGPPRNACPVLLRATLPAFAARTCLQQNQQLSDVGGFQR